MSTIYRSIKKKEEFICSLGTQPDINRKNRFTHIKDVQIAKLESWVYKVYKIKSLIKLTKYRLWFIYLLSLNLG